MGLLKEYQSFDAKARNFHTELLKTASDSKAASRTRLTNALIDQVGWDLLFVREKRDIMLED